METADLPRHFWFSSNTESRPRIHAIELSYIGVAGKAILTLEPTVSPDGRWLLYTLLDQAGSELMLVENFR
jgi:hypothetical protein